MRKSLCDERLTTAQNKYVELSILGNDLPLSNHIKHLRETIRKLKRLCKGQSSIWANGQIEHWGQIIRVLLQYQTAIRQMRKDGQLDEPSIRANRAAAKKHSK